MHGGVFLNPEAKFYSLFPISAAEREKGREGRRDGWRGRREERGRKDTE